MSRPSMAPLANRPAVIARAAALVFAFACVVLGVRFFSGESRRSYAMVFALPVSLALVAYAARTRAARGRASTFAAVVVAGWIVTIGAAGAWAIEAPIVDGASDGRLVTLVASIVGVFAPFASAGVADNALYVEAFVGRYARAGAKVAFVTVTACVALGLARGHRADPDTYLARLPIHAELHEDGSADLRGRTLAYPSGVPGRAVGTQHPCNVVLADANGDAVVATSSSCSGIAILRDEASDVWIVREKPPSERALVALRGAALLPGGLVPAMVGRSLAPPVGWTHGAAAGLVLAGVALVAARRFRLAAAALAVSPKPFAGGYRDAPARPHDDDARDELNARARGAYVTAFVVLGLTGGPVVVAVAHGVGL